MMSLLLLWLLHTGFALAACATALVWTDGVARGRRAAAVAVALAPLAWLAVLTWRTLELRFGLGIPHAPWRYASTLLAANALGAALLWRARDRAAGWSRAGVTFGALGLLVAEAVVLSNLYTAVLQRMGNLRVEAGLIAYAALPPKPAPEENAAPLILEATELLRAVEEDVDEVAVRRNWKEALEGDAQLDVDDPDLARYLAAVEPALARVRLAGDRPRFQPAQEGDGIGWIVLPDVTDVIDLGRCLVLSARVHLAHGERDAALADLTAMARLADHMLDTPALISTMVACVLRGRVRDELIDSWRRERLTAAEAARVPFGPRALDGLEHGMQLEEAYSLGVLGSGPSVVRLESGGGTGTSPVEVLGMIFLFDAELQTYRGVLAELRARVRDPEAASATPIEELRTRGLATAFLVPMLDDIQAEARYCDAGDELLRAALVVAQAWNDGSHSAQELLDDQPDLAGRFPDVRFEALALGNLRLSPANAEALEDRVPALELVIRGARLR